MGIAESIAIGGKIPKADGLALIGGCCSNNRLQVERP